MLLPYKRYLGFGILFVGVQEFWVSVVWRQDVMGFALAVAVTETLFITFTYFLSRAIERLFSSRIAHLVTYLCSGFAGLLTIEWYFMGNTPGATEASQFVMFSTWGGAALFARMQSDPSCRPVLRHWSLRGFLVLAGTGTVAGLVLLPINAQLSFAVTYLAANIGYPLMSVFFLAYLIDKFRKVTESQSNAP